MKKLMLVAGVGGHLTQLLQLESMFKKYDYVLVTEKTDVSVSLKNKYKVRYLNHISRNQKLLFPFVIIGNCFKSLFYIIKYNPDVIISTGPNTAAAICCLGKMSGKKVIFIESYAKRETPSITGKWLYRLHGYSTFVVQWESMLKYYPKAEYWGGVY